MSRLVRFDVDGWPLFRSGILVWIFDLDLAERAELAQPRDIRRTIKSAIEDGLLSVFDSEGAAPAAGTPLVRIERTTIEIANGGTQEVTEYYLNREAAVLIVMRLRTPKAVALQVAVVQVFFLAIDGNTGAPTPRRRYSEATLDQYIRDPLLERARQKARSVGRRDRQAISTMHHRLEVELRDAIAYPLDGNPWSEFTGDLNQAQAALREIGRDVVDDLSMSAYSFEGEGLASPGMKQLPLKAKPESGDEAGVVGSHVQNERSAASAPTAPDPKSSPRERVLAVLRAYPGQPNRRAILRLAAVSHSDPVIDELLFDRLIVRTKGKYYLNGPVDVDAANDSTGRAS